MKNKTILYSFFVLLDEMCYNSFRFGGVIMVNIRDIYNKIDIQLMEEDYWNLDIEDRKRLIDKFLKQYIILKGYAESAFDINMSTLLKK